MSDEVADLLDSAADLLEKEGWIQGEYRSFGEDGKTVGYCTVGALGYSLDSQWDANANDFEEDEEGRLVFEAAQMRLQLIVLPDFTALSPSRIIHWNDEQGRTQQEVLDTFRLAAKQERVSER